MSTGSYPSEGSLRRDIVEAGRRLYMRGLVCGNDGNISGRVSESEIIVTPSGVSKGFMTEEMLIKVDLDGSVSIGQQNERNERNERNEQWKPSSETKMHLAIYRKSVDIFSVCHAHPPIATTFAAAGKALDKAFLQETVMLLGVIPLAPYAAPGSEGLAESAADLCLDYHGALLEQHGAVSWGAGIMEALYRMESIEYTAQIAMYSKMLGFTRTLDKGKIDELISLRPNWGITASLGEFARD